MKIKLFFFLFLGTISLASAQQDAKGWDEGVAAIIEMTPYDLKDIPSIYVGNLPKAWKGKGNLNAYANKEKNLFSLYGTTFAKKEISVPQKVLDYLNKNKNSKAFLHKNERHLLVVDGKGKIVKRINR